MTDETILTLLGILEAGLGILSSDQIYALLDQFTILNSKDTLKHGVKIITVLALIYNTDRRFEHKVCARADKITERIVYNITHSL